MAAAAPAPPGKDRKLSPRGPPQPGMKAKAPPPPPTYEPAPYATVTEAGAREAAKEHREERQRSAERKRPPSPSRGRPRDGELDPLVVGLCPRGMPCCCFLCPAGRVQRFWREVGNTIFSGSFLSTACYVTFILSWVVFAVVAIIIQSYYDEHIRPIDTPPPDPSVTPASTVWSPEPRGSRTALNHYPMQLKHLGPGLLVTLGFALATGFDFREENKTNPLYVVWTCTRQLFLIGSILCTIGGVLLGFTFLLILIFNVDLYGRSYLIWPDVSALLNAFGISAAVGLCFWYKYMYLMTDTQRREDDPDDED